MQTSGKVISTMKNQDVKTIPAKMYLPKVDEKHFHVHQETLSNNQWSFYNNTQLTFTCPKFTMEALEKAVKYV